MCGGFLPGLARGGRNGSCEASCQIPTEPESLFRSQARKQRLRLRGKRLLEWRAAPGIGWAV